MKKHIIFVAVLASIVYFLGWHLQPFEPKFFSFHDDTQVGRMKEFAFSLKNLQIPPRLAPHFSFGMGFPVFNFYAPFSYWVGGILSILGVPLVAAAKTSFFLALIVMFVSMYLLLKNLFSTKAGVVGGIVYVSSPWVATEIFARGNIGELWFLALFPMSLYLLHKNSKSKSALTFFFTVLTASFLLTSHNVLSLVGLPFLLLYCLSLSNFKKNGIAIFIALLLSSYFFLPLIVESSLTYAKAQAESTPYADHYLCPTQLWSSPNWELGGSGVGCNDGMSFKIGKIQLILGILGFIAWFISSIVPKKRGSFDKKNITYGVIALFGITSLYMMLEISAPVWKLFSFALAAFQFPWRFNSLFLFFVAFFAGYLTTIFKNKIAPIISIPLSFFLIIMMLYSSRPYFRHPWRLSYNEYYLKYVSDEYIYKKIAYAIPEYLPKTASYVYWMTYRDTKKALAKSQTYTPFISDENTILITKNGTYEKIMESRANQRITINTTYFPYWEITVNEKIITPTSFDLLGRPILSVTKSSIVRVVYRQTSVELLANCLTILTAIGLGVCIFNKKLWNKLNNINI